MSATPMKCLALDTTTDICSIAVSDESGLIAEYNSAHKMDLSRRMMPNVVAMLRDAGLQMKDVEAVGVSIGPGSFTGLRIGVTTAKTLAQALNVPVVGIVTLDLLAHQFDYLPDAIVCPLIKVRKGEAYYAFYRTNSGSIERLTEYDAGQIDNVVDRSHDYILRATHRPVSPSPLEGEGGIPALQPRIIFCGDALQANLPTLSDGLGELAVPTPAWLSYPKASILARLALERISAGRADDPITLAPLYIRKSAPEQRLDECPRE